MLDHNVFMCLFMFGWCSCSKSWIHPFPQWSLWNSSQCFTPLVLLEERLPTLLSSSPLSRACLHDCPTNFLSVYSMTEMANGSCGDICWVWQKVLQVTDHLELLTVAWRGWLIPKYHTTNCSYRPTELLWKQPHFKQDQYMTTLHCTAL